MRPSLPMRIVRQSLFVILPCFPLGLILPPSDGCAAEGTTDRKIEELIADLRSDQFATREAATGALKERMDALPMLWKERRSVDLEVRRRVRDILATLGRKRLAKAKVLGKAGRAVEVADRLAVATKYGANGEEGWESLTRLAELMIQRSEHSLPVGMNLKAHRGLPAGEFRHYVELVNPKEIAEPKITIDTGDSHPGKPPSEKERAARKFMWATAGVFLLRGEEISLTGSEFADLRNGMIAASGDVQISQASYSFIVAGGDVKKIRILHRSIIICDGDVEMHHMPGSTCLIVARGRITCAHGPLRHCLARSGHTLHLYDGKTIDLNNGAADPFAFVKFFELADVGIIAEDLPPREKSAAPGVLLKEVRKNSPFANGLRAGDRIIAIEEKKTPTTEIFRRILRRKLAEDEPSITFSVQRSGKTLDVPIPMKN